MPRVRVGIQIGADPEFEWFKGATFVSAYNYGNTKTKLGTDGAYDTGEIRPQYGTCGSVMRSLNIILNSATKQELLIEDAIDIVINVINAERGLFVKYDEINDSFSIITARKISNESITDLHEFSSGILRKVIKEKTFEDTY